MNNWAIVAVILFFIVGFVGGCLYSYTLSKNDIGAQCNQFIEKHCYCYEDKSMGPFGGIEKKLELKYNGT